MPLVAGTDASDFRENAVTSSPLISVIIPAYNAEATLAETLASACRQTFRDIEILVVDDGSSDSTRELVLAACRTDNRIRLIPKQHSGLASTRNAGAARAHGEYLAPLDADDLWHPTKLQKQLGILERDPEIGFVYAHYRNLGVDGCFLPSPFLYQAEGRVLNQHLLFNFVGNGSSPLIRRSAFEAAGGYDSGLRDQGAEGCEDLLLQLRIAQRFKVGVAQDLLVAYRRGPGNMSSRRVQMARSHLLVTEQMRRICPDVSLKAFRWAKASQLVTLAAALSSEERQREAAATMASAFAMDPLGAAALLSTTRYLGRGGQAMERPEPDCDRLPPPDRPWHEHASAAPPHPLFMRRMRILKQLDDLADAP